MGLAERALGRLEIDLASSEISPNQLSALLDRTIRGLRALAEMTPPQEEGATVEELAVRAGSLRDATLELLRRTEAVDVTPPPGSARH